MIGCKNNKQEIVLILEATDDNLRNSEGDFIQLKRWKDSLHLYIFLIY